VIIIDSTSSVEFVRFRTVLLFVLAVAIPPIGLLVSFLISRDFKDSLPRNHRLSEYAMLLSLVLSLPVIIGTFAVLIF